jgi:hypothetical protein
MINVLEFDMSIDYRLAWNVAARATFHLFYNLSDCMILYRHQLSEPYIWTKFGCNHPDKIKFEKLDGKNLILFHTDVYIENTHKIKELIDYCQSNKIDLWIPFPLKNIWRIEEPHLEIIKDVLSNYQYNTYDLTNMNYRNENEVSSLIKEKMKTILRDIKLRNLFD